MTTLIICIDRDNDIGEKAHIKSPVIGREENLKAAISLGLADPEDSDTNSIFGAVKLYERLKSRGEDVEVVTIAGHKIVGVDSDRKVMEQLHQLVMDLRAKDAILVTDGAEDEGLLGLIQSRINVVGLERIMVKQERKIEGVYYYIQKAIEDEKMRKVVLPLALILMAWGMSLFFGFEGVMKGFIIFLIGAYLLMKTYHLEGDVNEMVTNISEQVKEGKFSWVFSSFSIILFVIGFFRSIDTLRNMDYYTADTSFLDIKFFIYIIIIMDNLIPWSILSLLVMEWGKFVDTAITVDEEEIAQSPSYLTYLSTTIFLIATGLFFKAGLNIIQYLADPDSIDFISQNVVSFIIVGILFLIGGRQIYGQRMEEEGYDAKRKRRLSLKRKKISGWRH